MKPIYLFDLDDTLLESSRRFEDGVLTLLDEEGILYDADAVTATILPIGVERTALYYKNILGVSGSADEIAHRIVEKQFALYRDVFALKAGVQSHLKRLATEGNRLFVLTATPKRLATASLRRNGILDLFEEVWSTEEDFGLHKDNEELFRRVAQRLEVHPSEICYFEDSVTAVETAKRVGYCTYPVYYKQTPEQIAQLKRDHRRFVYSFEDLSKEK